ncbi:MAG: YHS domain-containing protein [Candidatus Glassbacteria bacterium]|nr:YHS domain-containing protein [Candidatus Glassbacteria bacterium]
MKQQGILLEKTPNPQTLCPVMGNEVNRQVFADYGGKRVYFCCEDCREKFEAEPEKYLKKLKDQGVNLDDSPSLERFERGASEGEKHPEQH